MIQEIFLKRAVNIRKDYLNLTTDLSSYERMLRDIVSTIGEKHQDLIEIKNKIDDTKISSVDSAKSEFLKILIDLENDSNTLEKYIESINEKMDDLKKNELDLFRDIRQRYPEMSDSEIKSEVQEYIKKLNLS
jgi:predicted  nucleic acid-binding Zn-ribbon protein